MFTKNQQTTSKLKISEENPFMVGETDLEYFLDRPRRLDGGGILLCLSGQAEITVNMKNCIVEKDMQIMMLPKDMLMLVKKDTDFKVLYLFFSEKLFEQACHRIGSDLFGFLHENFYALLPPEAIDYNRHFFSLVRALYDDRENRFRNQILINHIQNYFLNSYDKIFRLHTQTEIKEIDHRNVLFKRFAALVHTHCTRNREVSFYANKLAISTRYLTAIAQSNKMISAKEFIDRAVIQEIKSLLHTTNLSIQEIAEQLNFPDQSYLGRYFKKQSGISPKEYRKKQ